MPSCKECIHYDMCLQSQVIEKTHTCGQFKNKADYNREQYAKGYCDGMSAIVEKIKEKYGQQDKFIPQKIITITGLQLNNLLKEMAGEDK